MTRKILAAVFLFIIFKNANSQDLGVYEKHWYVSIGDTLPYRLLLPLNYDAAKKYPIIFFLHGAGERGNDNEKQLMHGGKLFLSNDARINYPAIVVFPQCPAASFWSNVDVKRDESGKRQFNFQENGQPTMGMRLAQLLLQEIIEKYPVQKKQVYIGGLSMGGMGTFEMVKRNPELFAAALPICGGAHPASAQKLTKVKWWIFHGAKDDVVAPEYSKIMVDALEKAGAIVKFTLYPDANHNSWDQAFAEPQLLPWLFKQSK